MAFRIVGLPDRHNSFIAYVKRYMPKKGTTEKIREPQKQELPGSEKKMKPQPVFDNPE